MARTTFLISSSLGRCKSKLQWDITCHFIPSSMALIEGKVEGRKGANGSGGKEGREGETEEKKKNTWGKIDNKCGQRCRETGTFRPCLEDYKRGQSLGESSAISQKANHRVAVPLLAIYPIDIKNMSSQSLHMNLYKSTIHTQPKFDIT